MPRNLSGPMVAALTANQLLPALLLDVTFASGASHAWSGSCPLAYSGKTYLGVGSLGKISSISESTEVRSEGVTVGLSGLDPAWLAACTTDIQIGAPATLALATLDPVSKTVTGYYPAFGGQVDEPTIQVGAAELTIDLALENRLSNLQRGTCRRYTAADQHIIYPDDIGYNWVEIENDIALRWGN